MENPGPGNALHLPLRRADSGRPNAQQRVAGIPRGPRGRPRRGLAAPRQPGDMSGPVFRNPPQTGLVIPLSWSSQTSVTVLLKNIPLSANPWDIRQCMKAFGNVESVELNGQSGLRCARVRFEPPPTDLSFFQHGRCRLDIDGDVSFHFVEFPRHSHEEPTLATPLGNTCPASVGFRPERLLFGLLTRPATFMPKSEILKSSSTLNFTASFGKKKFVIHFSVLVSGERQHHRIDIKFETIRSIHRTTSEGHSAIVLAVHDPPLARRKYDSMDRSAWVGRLVWRESDLWHRAVEIRPAGQTPRARSVSLDEEADWIDFGRWTTYWMDLDKSAEAGWLAIESHLPDWNISAKTDVCFTQVPSRSPELWGLLADPLPRASSLNHDLDLLSHTSPVVLPYDVRYQLEVCISHGILSEYEIGRDFLEKLRELSTPTASGINRARLALEYAADQGRPIYDPMSLFEDRRAMTYYPATVHMPGYCALIRKVVVTPTRLYFHTPTVETTNRIVRRYKQVQDHFVRVQFTDEVVEGRIRASDADRDDEVYTRVYRVMVHGIRIGKWHYKFLAFGNSQIRENAAFFFCEPDDRSITCESIRQWMGDFNHISSVAKLAARLGQCFSTTRLLHCISSPRIVKIPDVESNGFCFTDGVGKLSYPLASLVSADWNISSTPSAFQFRMGGCKGILVTWPDAKGTEVHIRPSQEKFSAQFNGLEIIRCSQFACATLNRQTISILTCLGIPDEVFTDMMGTQISNYNQAMTDESKAVELLASYIDENMTTMTLADMVTSGFMRTSEPFVKTVLQLWRSWSIKALREKAKLLVDQGAFVLGCVDETGTLRGYSRATEGQQISRDQLPQIFLQIPDPEDRRLYKVITGLCLVGRNPSLHPGDLRVVEAVDVPQLRHLRDVVVFPLKGDRDIPSMCSGGDLDGDDFFVIWDPKLIPDEWTHPPMSYDAPAPVVETRASTAKSLATFFVLFMKNDKLPLIAHAHLATADYETDGARNWKCLKLAKLHSTAVDYVKTGVPAVWNKRLDPRGFPHFMEKAKKRSYRSTKVLGKLYDMVKKETFDNRENYKLPFDSRILKRYPVQHSLLREARKIKSQYDIGMRRVMGQLEIRTEFEVWTTFVMTKPRVGTDYKVQEKVGREAAGLKKQFRDLCLKTIEDHGFDKLPFVAAMYRVTWEETQIALYEARQPHVLPDGRLGVRRVTARSMPLISFPWLFPTELGCIALGTDKLPSLSAFSAYSKLVGVESDARTDSKEVHEVELDLAGMDYTKTSDGQYVHRGEILHLFRHGGDDEEGFYGSDGAAVGADSGLESASEGEQTTAKSVGTSSQIGAGDVPLLVDLGTDMDDDKPSSSLGPTTERKHADPPSTMPGNAADSATLDLLMWDADPGAVLSPCLTPTSVSVAQGQDTSTEPRPAADSDADAKAAVGREETHEPGTKPAVPNYHVNANASWDRVTTPETETPRTPEDILSVPVQYFPVVRLANGCYGISRTPMTAEELWGRARGEGKGREGGEHDMDLGLEEKETLSPGLDSGGKSGVATTQPRVGPATLAADSSAPGRGAEAAESGDSEVEYEEDVIEFEGESALKRLARLR